MRNAALIATVTEASLYAPPSSTMSARRAVSRPLASTPVVRVSTAACLVVVSMLSSKVRPRRTGTPATRAISATSGSILQYDLPPKPPPTGGVWKQTLCNGMPKTRAMSARMTNGSWLQDHSSTRSPVQRATLTCGSR